MVFTHSYIFTWVVLSTSLSYDDVPSNSFLTTKNLHA